jgi:hypothetical protein
VLTEQVQPALIADRRGEGSGFNDVGEENGGQYPVTTSWLFSAGEEFFDMIEDGTEVAGMEGHRVGALDNLELDIVDVLDQILAKRQSMEECILPSNDESRDPN